MTPATSTSSGTRRSLEPLPLTRNHRPPMSTSPTSRASTSPARSPQNTINPAMARSRHVRRLPTRATTSLRSRERGRRCGSRSRSADRCLGRRATWASIPLRSPSDSRLASLPLGTGFLASGSRKERNPNSPEIAASRLFTVAGAYPSARPPSMRTTLGPGRPRTVACRHAARYRSKTSVVTASRSMSSALNHRQNASSEKP
jgi:hypothetical protein